MTTKLLQANIQSLLHEADLSESELARRIDIPRATLNRLVAGKMASPKLHVLYAIADYFDVPVGQLMLPKQGIPNNTSTQTITILPLVPWDSVHQPHRFADFPQQSWSGFKPPEASFLSYANERRLDTFPNYKQCLLIAPKAKPRPGQLVMLRLNDTGINVIRQMFLVEQQFRFKHPNTPTHECLDANNYTFIGVVHQVLQLD